MGLAIVFILFVFAVVYKDELMKLFKKLYNKYKGNNTNDENNNINEDNGYIKPSVNLLNKNKVSNRTDTDLVYDNTILIESTFKSNNIEFEMDNVDTLDKYTSYRLKVNNDLIITDKLKSDLKSNLCEDNIEIIKDNNSIEIRIPNEQKSFVTMREVIRKMNRDPKVTLLSSSLGKDKDGNIKYIDILKAPHILIAGKSHSGKTNFINNIIVSVLLRNTPYEVKLALIDTDKDVFNPYHRLPHLYDNITTNKDEAIKLLSKISNEIDDRLIILKKTNYRNITLYNESNKGLPYILVIIDDLSKLISFNQRKINDLINKIIMYGKKCGIHLIVSNSDINSLSKELSDKFNTKMVFELNRADSNFYLNVGDATEQLDDGELVYKNNDEMISHVHSCYVSINEIKKIVEFINNQNIVIDNTEEEIILPKETKQKSKKKKELDNELYEDIKNYTIEIGSITPSLIQKKYPIHYNKILQFLDRMQEEGIIEPEDGNKPRKVIKK